MIIMINNSPLDTLMSNNAELALDLEYQKHIVNDDVIDNRLEVAENEVFGTKDTKSEITEAKAIINMIDINEELACESTEINRILESARRDEDISFDEITGI